MKREIAVSPGGGKWFSTGSCCANRLKPVFQARNRLKPVPRARKGYSLIELITVITGLSIVLGNAVVLMQLMLGMNGGVRDRTHAIATLGRLAEQFRRDAHEARELNVAESRQSAKFDLSGGKVVAWEVDEQGNLCRSETGTSKGRQNTYALPKGTTASLELQNHDSARIAVLRIESPDAAGPSLSIEALMGRDARPSEEEKK